MFMETTATSVALVIRNMVVVCSCWMSVVLVKNSSVSCPDTIILALIMTTRLRIQRIREFESRRSIVDHIFNLLYNFMN